jgi:hypothetical protein
MIKTGEINTISASDESKQCGIMFKPIEQNKNNDNSNDYDEDQDDNTDIVEKLPDRSTLRKYLNENACDCNDNDGKLNDDEDFDDEYINAENQIKNEDGDYNDNADNDNINNDCHEHNFDDDGFENDDNDNEVVDTNNKCKFIKNPPLLLNKKI